MTSTPTAPAHYNNAEAQAWEAGYEAAVAAAQPSMAQVMATVTGATSSTYTVERRNADGTLTVVSAETYTR